MKGNCTKLKRYNGSSFDYIEGRLSITDPGRTRESIESEKLLDCELSGASGTLKKSPGVQTIGDLAVEVLYNPNTPQDPGPPVVVNDHNHNLFEEDFDTETATWWVIEYPDDAGSGTAIYGFVQDLSSVEITPDNDIKRTFTIVPTGSDGGYVRMSSAADWTVPAEPVAPVANYSS